MRRIGPKFDVSAGDQHVHMLLDMLARNGFGSGNLRYRSRALFRCRFKKRPQRRGQAKIGMEFIAQHFGRWKHSLTSRVSRMRSSADLFIGIMIASARARRRMPDKGKLQKPPTGNGRGYPGIQ